MLKNGRAAACDADVPVAGGRAGLVERGLDAVVDEVEGRAAPPPPRGPPPRADAETRRVQRRPLRPHLLAGVEHALAHHARARALERLARDVVVTPFLAARAEL